MPDNTPATILATLKRVIEERRYGFTAAKAGQQSYGKQAVSDTLNNFLDQVSIRNVTAFAGEASASSARARISSSVKTTATP